MARTRGRETRTTSRGAMTVVAALIAVLALATTATAQNENVPLPRTSPAESAEPIMPAANADSGGAVVEEGDPGHIDLPGDGNDALLDVGATDDSLEVDPLNLDADAAAATPDIGPPADIRPGSFTLEARLSADGPALRDGVRWRIFGDALGSDGKLPLLGDASGGVIYVKLDAGTYYVHAAFGHAGSARRIDVTGPTGGQVVVLNAGGMRLLAVNGEDEILTAGEVAFDISAYDEGGESYTLVQNIPPGRVVGLAAGTYHVVCRFGDANAIVRADIRVDAGKLTEATLYQKAARLTLKLVEEHGGEALANTAWSVVTPAGESVIESVGAFPSVVLATGDYRAIADHDGKVYESDFKVEAGVDRDIEVLLK